MWNRVIQDAWHHGKRAIGHAWETTHSIAAQLDHGMNIAKRLYGALAPALHGMGGANKAIMGGFQAYDSAKSDVVGMHNQVAAMQGRIRRAVPEIEI